MNYLEERQELISYGKKMKEEGLAPGTSGNLSVFLKEENLVLISPSGIDYHDLREEDLVLIDLDGNVIGGDKKPSSEWFLHTNFYKNRDDIFAIVHTHSMYCACLAAMRMPILAVHYVLADANTNRVPCAPYERYGSKSLAKKAVETCGESKGVLLANHGLVTLGEDLKSAFNLAKTLEYVAEIQVRTMAIGRPFVLNKKEMDQVIDAFKGYGQK